MDASPSPDKLARSGLKPQRGLLEIEEMRIKLENDINERKFELSKQGLKSGSIGVGLTFCILLALISFTYLRSPSNPPVLSGWHVVTIIFILVAGLVGYFSLVFWREVKLAAELSKESGRIGINIGKDAG